MSKPPAGDPDLLHRHAQAAVLAGLQRGDDIDTLVGAVARYDIPGSFTPDVAMLELAVDALNLPAPQGRTCSSTRAYGSATCPR